MIGQVVETNRGHYIGWAPDSGKIASEADILELIACGGEIDSSLVLLGQADLADDFFDLKTGLAGAIFQKFANYRIKAAVVVDFDAITGERFRELMSECNKGNQIRFFGCKEEAEKWLLA